MFDGQAVLMLDGDHLDLSFRAEESWPSMTPAGSIRNYTFGIGDQRCGPLVQLGLVTTSDEEPLDWRHVVDPPHFHGSDQFRVLAGGRWSVGPHHLDAGDYLFQESGLVYREHPVGADPAWLVLVIGDRRGLLPTIVRDADRETLIDAGANFRAADSDDYAHPAGPKGVAAVSTSAGPCHRGYLSRREIGDYTGSSLTATFGDVAAGPSVTISTAAAHHQVIAETCCATEQLIVVNSGSAVIDDIEYRVGDIRIQAAGVPMGAIVAGASGGEITVLVGDRRCLPVAE